MNGSRDVDIAGVARAQVRAASSCRGCMKGASVYPTRKNLVKLPAEWTFRSSKLFAEAGMVPRPSPSLHMDTGRVEGHSSRLLAAIAVGVHGRRDRWLWALGLQLPPGPHSPVTNETVKNGLCDSGSS